MIRVIPVTVITGVVLTHGQEALPMLNPVIPESYS